MDGMMGLAIGLAASGQMQPISVMDAVVIFGILLALVSIALYFDK